MSIESEFRAAMREGGVTPAPNVQIVADDKIHRFQLEDEKAGRESGAYQLRIDGDFAFGWFKDWRNGDSISYSSKQKRAWSDEEKAEWRRRMEADKADRERDAIKRAQDAKDRAKRIWASCSRDGHSDYLTRKGVICGAARFGRNGMLVVPVYQGTEIAGLQFIPADGDKRFLRDTPKKGGYCGFQGDRDTIYICEGFATAASVNMATGKQTICAFDAGNLPPVSRYIRERFPDARLVIAGDNDDKE